MPTHKPTELSRIKLIKLRQPVPMMSEHLAHLTSLPVNFNAKATYQSKGDKLSCSAECRIRTLEVWDTKSLTDRMPTHKPTELATIKQNLNSIARPYCGRAFRQLDITASWLSHLALAIYMFVVVNFDDLSQASDSNAGFQTWKPGSLRH